MSPKFKIACYVLLGIALTFIFLSVIIALLGDSSAFKEENEKLKREKKKVLTLLGSWNDSLNPLFVQEMLDILKGEEKNGEIISIQSENSGQEKER